MENISFCCSFTEPQLIHSNLFTNTPVQDDTRDLKNNFMSVLALKHSLGALLGLRLSCSASSLAVPQAINRCKPNRMAVFVKPSFF